MEKRRIRGEEREGREEERGGWGGEIRAEPLIPPYIYCEGNQDGGLGGHQMVGGGGGK